MALHRDIFWVGKQWAVTGYGMQAVDQKQKSKFDIEASRLWEDDLLEVLSDQRWFNLDDFNAGLSIARAKYPEPPGKAASPKKAVVKESAPAPVAPPKPAPKIESKVDSKLESKIELKAELKAQPPKADATPKSAKPLPAAEPAKPQPRVEPAKPNPMPPAPPRPVLKAETAKPAPKVESQPERKKRPAAQFSMRIGPWRAKFTPMWRVRTRQQ